MSRMWMVLLALAALLLLCLLCVQCHGPGIQGNLQSRSEVALAGANLKDVAVFFDGRDAKLTGTVPTDAARDTAGAVVGGVRGVRRVSNDLEVSRSDQPLVGGALASGGEDSAAAALGEGDSRKLRLGNEQGNLTLSGMVPNAERLTGLVAEARSLWGDDQVHSELRVNEAMDIACWPDSFVGLLTSLKNQGQNLQLSMTGCGLELTGSALSDLSRERILGSFATALPSFEIKNSLAVRQAQTTAEKVQADLDSFLAAKIVEFANNSAELKASGKAVLDQVAEILRGADTPFEISGHTDSKGSEDYNLDLSRLRAEEVRRYLVVEGGIEESRLSAAGYGETRPVADNETPEGRQKNRRTEFRAQAQ